MALAPVLVQHKINSAGGTTISFTVAPKLGNTVVFGQNIATGVEPVAPTDNKGNTYTKRKSVNETVDGVWVQLWTAPVNTTGGTFTVTFPGGGTVWIAEIYGANTAVVDSASAIGSAPANGTITTTEDNTLIIVYAYDEGSLTHTPGSGLTSQDEEIDNVTHQRAYAESGAAATAGSQSTAFGGSTAAGAYGWVAIGLHSKFEAPVSTHPLLLKLSRLMAHNVPPILGHAPGWFLVPPAFTDQVLAPATLSFTGNMTTSNVFMKLLSATLSFTGNVAQSARKVFAGVLSFTGSFTRSSLMLSLFQDSFNAGALDTAKWAYVNNVLQGGGVITISLNAATAIYNTLYGGVSGRLFDARGGHAFVQLVSIGNQAIASKEVFLEVLQDATHEVFLYVQSTSNGGSLVAYKNIGAGNVSLATIPYDPVAMAYWQIREAGGTTYWEYGPTPFSMTALWSETNPIDMSAVWPQLTAGTYASEVLATTVVYDNFNFAGNLFTQALNGVLSFVGAQQRLPRKNFPAQLSFTGSATKQISKKLTAAALSFTGAFSKGSLFFRTVTGALSFTGSVATKRTAFQNFVGQLSFTGSFSLSNVFKRALVGVLSFTGTPQKSTSKKLTGGLSFTGTFKKLTQKILPTAILSFVGSVVKRATERMAGVLSFTGSLSLSNVFKKAFTATLSFTGKVLKQSNKKAFAGVLSFTGTVKRARSMILSATLSFSGALAKRMRVNLFGNLSFTSVLDKYIVPHFVAIGAIISSFTNQAKDSSSTNVADVETGATISDVQSKTREGDVQSNTNAGDLQSTDPNKTLEG